MTVYMNKLINWENRGIIIKIGCFICKLKIKIIHVQFGDDKTEIITSPVHIYYYLIFSYFETEKSYKIICILKYMKVHCRPDALPSRMLFHTHNITIQIKEIHTDSFLSANLHTPLKFQWFFFSVKITYSIKDPI